MNSEQIFSAILDDDEERLSDLIANSTDLKFKIPNSNYRYPELLILSENAPLISIAAYFGSEKCYNYFLNYLTDIPNFKISLFSYACAGGNMNIIRDVESKFPELFSKAKSIFIAQPGFLAVSYCHFDVVKWLFVKGYNFTVEEIEEACSYGLFDIFNFLFEHVDFDRSNFLTYNHLIESACFGGNEKILMKLFARYTLKKFTKSRYFHYIQISIKNGNFSCLKYLLDNTKIIFPRSSSYFIQPSLMCASSYEFIDIIMYLIKIGGTYNKITNFDSPLAIALTTDSTLTAKFFLDKLPKISDDQIVIYFKQIFMQCYSFDIIQLLLKYMNKTLLDLKEFFAQLAVKYDIHLFFDDLVANHISLDFLKVELFDFYADNFNLFMHLYDLGAQFKFDKHNKVFMRALSIGNQEFIQYAISKGAILDNEIIEESDCLSSSSRFYRHEDNIELLFRFNIDISKYSSFLELLITSSGSKTYIYENLALRAINRGAIITRNAVICTIKAKWSDLFHKEIEKHYYPIQASELSLSDCRLNRYPYEDILTTIFNNQPSLLDEVINIINENNIQSNIADKIRSIKGNRVPLLFEQTNDYELDIRNLLDSNFSDNYFDD